MNIPNIPIQILAVTETGSANAFFSSDLSHQLITEGNAVADKLQAHFMTSSSTSQQKSNYFTYLLSNIPMFFYGFDEYVFIVSIELFPYKVYFFTFCTS